MKKDKFIQGYVCAIASVTAVIGDHSNVQEALYWGIGKRTSDDLIKLGVEQSDIDKLKEVGYLK